VEAVTDPIDAVRSKPGEFFLAAESVAVGDRFKVHDAVYEITGEPTRWGISWIAEVTVIEGLKRGSAFRAMLHTGRKVEG
jgi:hypothetical protein